jgi:hypothetical protein
MCGVFSGRSVLRMAGCNIVCRARIPALELWPERRVPACASGVSHCTYYENIESMISAG